MANKNLDKVFSDALQKHRTPPPKRAWERIERGLDGKKAKAKHRRFLLWFLLLTTSIAGTSYAAWKHYQKAQLPLARVQGTAYVPLENELPKDIAGTLNETLTTEKEILQEPQKIQTTTTKTITKRLKTTKAKQSIIHTKPLKNTTRTALPVEIPNQAALITRMEIPSMAVKPPKRKYNIRVEITIPYKEKKPQATSEPKKKKINWRSIVDHVIDD